MAKIKKLFLYNYHATWTKLNLIKNESHLMWHESGLWHPNLDYLLLYV